MVGGKLELWLEVRREEAAVGRSLASPAPCVEDALLRGLLTGRFENDGALPDFAIEPTWAEAGTPTAAGLTLTHDGEPAGRYSADAFAPQAQLLIRRLLREGRLEPQDRVTWELQARERDGERLGAARVRRDRLPLRQASLPGAARGELRVEIERGVMEGLREWVASSLHLERAGLLLGELLHDAARGAGAARVTGWVPVEAGAGGASRFHFAFGPESLVRARREAQQSAGAAGLCTLGWVHSHPPCEQCASNPDCRTDLVFFSADDVEVHASAFPSAYMIALVAGKVGHLPATKPGFRLYGWRDAVVGERPFQVTEAGPSEAPEEEETWAAPRTCASC